MVKRPLVVIKRGENPWVKYCKQRISHRKNNALNIAATGEPGSGKSWALLGFARQYNPEWSLDNCYFKASEFVKAMRDGKFKRGSFVLYDEASVDMNSMSWQNELNRAMNLVFSTMRHRNLIVGLTFPFMSFLAKPVRKLMTAHFEAHGWDKDNNSIIKPRVLQFNDRMDKFYTPRLLVRNSETKQLNFCDYIKIPKADMELLKEYEKRKKEFTTTLFDNSVTKLEAHENKSMRGVKYTKELTEHQENILNDLKEGFNVGKLIKKYGVSDVSIYGTIASIKKKGFTIKPVRDGDNCVLRYNVRDCREIRE